MLTLHVAQRSRSIRARWLLEEAGVPHDIRVVEPSSLPPLEELPVLELDGTRLVGSLPVLLLLADRFGTFAPRPESPERADYLRWLTFSEALLDPMVVSTLSGVHPGDRLTQALDVLDAHLSTRDVVGTTFSAADISLASLLHLASHQALLDAHRRLVDYVRRHTARPALRRAFIAPSPGGAR